MLLNLGLCIRATALQYNQCSYFYKEAYRRKLLKMCLIYLRLKKQQNKPKRQYWVRDIFTNIKRRSQGCSHNLVAEMRNHDQEKFRNFLRMCPETFDLLLSIVEKDIKKQSVIRESIEPRIRLEVTLHYLASGDSMVSLSYLFRIGKQTVSAIIAETCNAIWVCLKDQVFIKPTEDNWRTIAKEFESKWNFKNCLGAIDGKHVIMQALPNSGSKYYNYKGSHSINLLAITDANYQFIMVDIGAPGRFSDSGIFRDSQMGHGFDNNLLNVPPEDEENFPYVLVGDEAFPLSTYLMRPYPRSGQLDMRKKVFNYRLSRARRIVENSFGILVAKWRIFRKPIIASEATIRKIIQSSVALHNFLLMQRLERNSYTDVNEIVTSEGLIDITKVGSNTYSKNSAVIRDRFSEYFCGDGAVEWQWQKALENNF